MRALGQGRRQYVFTEELRTALKEAYALRMPAERSKAIGRLAEQTGWPRGAFLNEAGRLGITARRRIWTAAEDAWLRDRVGTVSLKYLARRLKRSERAVEQRMYVLRESRLARREGYSMTMLVVTLGCSIRKVRKWFDRGLFGKVHEVGCAQRVSAEAVVRFLREYPYEYDLRRVDQDWYKSMLFGELSEVA